jgi:hypothetical protein
MGIGDFDGIRLDSAFGFLRPVFMAATLNFLNTLAALFCEGSTASWNPFWGSVMADGKRKKVFCTHTLDQVV